MTGGRLWRTEGPRPSAIGLWLCAVITTSHVPGYHAHFEPLEVRDTPVGYRSEAMRAHYSSARAVRKCAHTPKMCAHLEHLEPINATPGCTVDIRDLSLPSGVYNKTITAIVGGSLPFGIRSVE